MFFNDKAQRSVGARSQVKNAERSEFLTNRSKRNDRPYADSKVIKKVAKKLSDKSGSKSRGSSSGASLGLQQDLGEELLDFTALPKKVSDMTPLQLDLLNEQDVFRYHDPGPLKPGELKQMKLPNQKLTTSNSSAALLTSLSK